MKLSHKIKAVKTNYREEELAGSIALGIISVQKRVADWLNTKAKKLSGDVTMVLLILFCVLFAAINSYLIIYSINH